MTVFGNGRVVTSAGLLEVGWVEVREETIVALGLGVPDQPLDVDLNGRTLVPGFVDQHCHGGGGSSFITTDEHEARRAAELHLSHGTTSMLASLVSGSQVALTEQVEVLSGLVDDNTIVGIHLEGPWISSLHCGAHDVAELRAPQPQEVAAIFAVGAGRIKMVTIAPELDGAIEAIGQIVDAGAIAAVGHCDADYETTVAAIDAGARVATHLYNAIRPLSHRDPGAIGALLEDPRVDIELIADGTHLHRVVLNLVVREAGASRVSMITDAMAAAGAADGRYVLGELDVDVVDGVARLVDGGAIAGSTLTMDGALRFMTMTVGLPIAEVVEMVSTTPARVLGLADRGSIEVGRRADLVVLGTNLGVDGVMQGGVWAVAPKS